MQITQNKILIIGYGNMGSSFYKGLIKIFPVTDIFVSDNNQDKIAEILPAFKSTNPHELLHKVDTVIIAVKPQVFPELSQQIRHWLQSKLIISIMAGVKIAKIAELTDSQQIIRSMPNLAASVENSVTGWLASEGVTETQKALANQIFGQIGESIEVKKESQLDEITALSGSGPAYYFYLTEILTEKAKNFGFNTTESKKIAERTLIGAAKLLEKNTYDAKTWKEMVTSKGGTTEVALTSMTEDHLDEILKRAVNKAKKRSEELSK